MPNDIRTKQRPDARYVSGADAQYVSGSNGQNRSTCTVGTTKRILDSKNESPSTAIHSRGVVNEGGLMYRNTLHQFIQEKPTDGKRYHFPSISPPYLLHVNNSKTDEIIHKIGFNSLTEFLCFICSTEFTDENYSTEECFNYQESLLALIQNIAKEHFVAISYCYHGLYIISYKLDDTKLTSFYHQKSFDHDNFSEVNYELYQSLGIEQVDFQQATHKKKRLKSIKREVLRQSVLRARKVRAGNGNDLFQLATVSTPIDITATVIKKTYQYIKDNDCAVIYTKLFTAIISSVSDSLVDYTNSDDSISDIMDTFFNPANQVFFNCLKEKRSLPAVYQEIYETYSIVASSASLVDKLNDISEKYNLSMTGKNIADLLQKQGIGKLMCSLDRAVFYEYLYLIEVLVVEKNSMQQKTTTNEHKQSIESDAFLLKLEGVISVADKLPIINSLDDLSSIEYSHIKYLFDCTSRTKMQRFICGEVLFPLHQINTSRLCCDLFKPINIIYASFCKAFIDSEKKPQLLLTEHIPFFKYVAQTEGSEYKKEAWFVAGEIAAHCLYSLRGIQEKEILQDAKNSYLESAKAGNYRGYYKAAELLMSSPKAGSLEIMQEALGYYTKALEMVDCKDENLIVHYSATIEILQCEIDEEIERQKALEISKPVAQKKSSKAKSRSKKEKITDKDPQKDPVSFIPQDASFNSIPSAIDGTKVKSPKATQSSIKYTREDRKQFWENLKFANTYMRKYELEDAKIYLDMVTANPFYKNSEKWVQAMVIQNKTFCYYTLLQMSLSEDVKFYFLDSDRKKTTPSQITEHMLVQKICDLISSGLKLLGVDQSDARLLEEDIDISRLSVFERKQLASLLSTRAHVYSYQAMRVKGLKKTKLRSNYQILYNKADMINPSRLLRTHEY